MADFDWKSRMKITEERKEGLGKRIRGLSGMEKQLALDLMENRMAGNEILNRIVREYEHCRDKKPSQWFSSGMRRVFLDGFVPKGFQESYLYVIDKMNRFPFPRGWSRRSIRTAGYGPQIRQVFSLLLTYERLFYIGENLEAYILKRLDPEKLDYVRNVWEFNMNFSYVYAAEIDRGNQAVIGAFKELILSENNTAYLDREMILGIVRSDNRELQELLCGLLLAARLQEGLRQAICEAMDEGTGEAFLKLFRVVEEHDLIRYSSVKRAVSTWIGIFDENSVDRISGKLLTLMGQCLRDEAFCRTQLGTNDSVAISTALWALGFYEVEDAVRAMEALVDSGTKNQRLTAAFYNGSLYDQEIRLRIAKKVILEQEDMELSAAFMPAFDQWLSGSLWKAFGGDRYVRKVKQTNVVPVTDCYESREEAEKLYDCFRKLYKELPKKGVVYDPCIFPWYRVELTPGQIVEQMAFLAFVLRDEEKITFVAELLGESAGGYGRRGILVNLLLYCPVNKRQRELLIGYMGNADSQTSSMAVEIVKKMTLEDGEYRLLEDMLRFKRSSLRGILIGFLMEQKTSLMKGSLERLLQDKKEEKRSAGLDILLRLSKDEKQRGFFREVREMASLVEKPTDKEKILIGEILGGEKKTAEDKPGYGIYDPSVPEVVLRTKEGMPEGRNRMDCAGTAGETAGAGTAGETADAGTAGETAGAGTAGEAADAGTEEETAGVQAAAAGRIPFVAGRVQEDGETEEYTSARLLKECMPFSEKEAVEKLRKLDRLFEEYKDYEYLSADGQTTLLGNGYKLLKEAGGVWNKPFEERFVLENYPLSQVFERFYREEIGDYRVFVELDCLLAFGGMASYQAAKVFYQAVFGCMPIKPEELGLNHRGRVDQVRQVYRNQFRDQKALFETGLRVVSAMTQVINKENKIVRYPYTGWNGTVSESTRWISSMPFFSPYMDGIRYWETDQEFVCAFETAWKLEVRCQEDRRRRRFMPSGNSPARGNSLTPIVPYWFLKAYHMGLVSEDVLYKAVMEYFAREDCLKVLCEVKKGEAVKVQNRRCLDGFFGWELTNRIYQEGEAFFGEDTWLGSLIREMYDRIVPVLVDMELRRGEAETDVSWDVRGVTYIRGISYLIRILIALGKDTLGRETYYSWYYGSRDRSKRQVLSGFLKVSYPADGETGKDLKRALKDTSIKAARLVETAMYAPQWIDVIQDYLGWAGLKSGCYYFMAHMNERFDDQKAAMIAKYTPLTPEELQDGAFDVAWFEEAYGLLGEKNFGMLYNGAKYISDGQKHARARKYADAATGKVTTEMLRQEITAKRNKDLLMSYGLVPFRKDREQDMLERYQFIQQFYKESRQFGAQRRASEAKAVQLALVNLSVRAGYRDVTRLTLNMESRLAESFGSLMEWHPVEDVEVCLQVGEDGKSGILCRKDGKMLKSVPSRLGKKPYVLEVKEAHKRLKDQYSRTRAMMENAMEDGTGFQVSEVMELLKNPVVRPILEPLVYVKEGHIGFLQRRKDALGLGTWDGRYAALKPDEEIRIAHPLDLYREGTWHEYQKYLFDHELRQPFKQVFRELYVKLAEELGQRFSRMFAGNQIQPAKTVGCLRGRRWVADYEDGLQKIYYKENIIARIYAMADWFSPSEIEAPALEWVEFSDRKTFRALTIEEVPDLIYSEVMRDVDLAVSVAHAGGVDPETSHSTIEMRRAIVEFNLPLFGIQNVELTGSHALIKGSRAVYNVHLGSGVIHQEGGAMLNILPVHSQKRGKLFLPFVDEDPKTAEIMSKIVLLAEDKKIKDPFILDQIH